MRYLIVVAITIFVCFKRTQVVPGLDMKDLFKDMSHIFVGGLLGAGIAYYSIKDYFIDCCGFNADMKYEMRFFLSFGVGITLFEIVCAVIGKYTGQPIF